MKQFLKDFAYLTCIMAYVLGTISGIGMSLYYDDNWVAATAILINAVLAFPVVKYLVVNIGK